MKQTLSTSHAVDLLLRDEYAKQSRPAAEALIAYYEDLENETGSEIEFDQVAIRCDWNEFDTAKEFADQYMDPKDLQGLEEDELIEAVEEYMNDHSFMIKLDNDNGYLVQNF